ncbi:MAG: GntR family transcriptional regulator [Bacilli bacterium]
MDFQYPTSIPLRTQAYTILKEAIISGTLAENKVIKERHVLEQFHISRTPFREALQSLETEGWVYTIPYKGAYVSPITDKDITDMYELRIILETAIARKIQSVQTTTLNELSELVTRMEMEIATNNDYRFMMLDRDFHLALYRLSGNSKLIAVGEQIGDSMRRIGGRILHKPSRKEEVIVEHRAIISGLVRGDAENAIVQHLKAGKRALTPVR